MRNPLHTDEFESFLQDQVNNHRMFPSDKIWRNIQNEIHGEGKWPALTYISIFVITALAICTWMVKPEERLNKNIAAYPTEVAESNFKITKLNQQNAVESAPVQHAYADNITQQTLQSVNKTITEHAQLEKTGSHQVAVIEKVAYTTLQDLTVEAKMPSNATVKPATQQSAQATANNTPSKRDEISEANDLHVTISKPASMYFSTIGLMDVANLKKPSVTQSSYDNDDIWRNYQLVNAKDSWRKNLSKFSFQFYIAPSVSYRRLNDAHGKTVKSYTAFPLDNNYQLDVNRIVEHSPAMGAEVGFALGYKLTDALTLKGGFQFNVRQYNIRAYTIPESDPSLSARSENAVMNNTFDTQDTTRTYLTSNNFSDVSKSVVLSNRYYEIAAPIGIDWRIFSGINDRLTVNVAAALQPTYTFDKEPFVVTTDYKSYTDGASIMRNWNLNSNIEAYISYKIGPFRWQLGPQIRYQHLSTYSYSYPIREHLLDYGIKLGFTKSIK